MLAKLARDLATRLYHRVKAPDYTGQARGAADAVARCLALMDAGEVDAASACYEALLESYPFNALACNNLGIIRQRQGALREAAGLFRRAIQSEPVRAQP